MKLVNFRIMEISIPFHFQFKHSLAARNKSSSVIFEVTADNGMRGYGEGSPREYVTGESIATTIKALRYVSQELKYQTIDLTNNVIDTIKNLHCQFYEILEHSPSAKCAMELALLDLFGKIFSKPVLSLFGKQKTFDISYSGIITQNSISKISKILDIISVFNIKQVKIKDSNDFISDSKKFMFIRSFLGNNVEFRVDANGVWSLREAIERIEFYNKYNVNIFEQPMATDLKNYYPVLLDNIDRENHIIVDEGVCTYDDAIWFIENKGATGINLKISKHGGLINTLLIHQISSKNGFKNQLGCHVGETSILTSAGIVFAGLTNNLIAYEGAYGGFLLEFDLIKNPIQFGKRGSLKIETINNQIGFGLEINPFLINSASINSYQH